MYITLCKYNEAVLTDNDLYNETCCLKLNEPSCLPATRNKNLKKRSKNLATNKRGVTPRMTSSALLFQLLLTPILLEVSTSSRLYFCELLYISSSTRWVAQKVLLLFPPI